jgi:hypothetical protein
LKNYEQSRTNIVSCRESKKSRLPQMSNIASPPAELGVYLGLIKSALGDLDRVERFVKLIGYVNVAPGFTKMPQVVNGASDLFVELWGERGEHARAAVGVASLANDAPVETEVIVHQELIAESQSARPESERSSQLSLKDQPSPG